MARQGGGGLWGYCPHALAVVGVQGLLVPAHGTLRVMAAGLVPVAVMADAAALLGLPREGACQEAGMAKMCLRQVQALGQLSFLLCLGHISFPISFI